MRSEYAVRVQNLLYQLNHDDETNWQNALLHLLETYHMHVTTLDTTIPIETYLDQAVGFQVGGFNLTIFCEDYNVSLSLSNLIL